MSRPSRIQLSRLAGNHGATEGEIQAAMLQAQRMMERYHLTADDVEARSSEEDLQAVDLADLADYRVFVGRRVAIWETALANYVAEFVGVPMYRDDRLQLVRRNGIVALDEKTGEPIRGKSFVFYGISDDAALAVHTFETLRLTIATMARCAYGAVYVGDGATYCYAFVQGLRAQMEAEQRQRRISADSTALIRLERTQLILQRKADRAREWLSSTGTKTQRATFRSRLSGSEDAWEHGHRDGAATEVSRVRQRKLT